MQVMQGIMGNWDRSLGASPLLSSRLSTLSHRITLPKPIHILLHVLLRHQSLGHLPCVREPHDPRRHGTFYSEGVVPPIDVEVEPARSQLKPVCHSLLMGRLLSPKTSEGNLSPLVDLVAVHNLIFSSVGMLAR
jgi:hypothetical protein